MALLQPQPGELTVRMYRQGLGDCFLLAFGTGDRPFYMLVDCGVLKGTTKGAAKLEAVARNVRSATGGEIDVLAITHEHYDHVSGFLYKGPYKIYRDEVRFDRLWLAWTEDPEDGEARAIKNDQALRMRGLQAAVSQLQATDPGKAGAIQGLLDFYGLGARHSVETERALRNALRLVPQRKKRDYWQPGRTVEPVPGLRVYFLGPPRGPLLRKSDPSATDSEVYEAKAAVNDERNFLIAALHPAGARSRGLPPEEWEMLTLSYPFSDPWRIYEPAAFRHEAYGEFFSSTYGVPDSPAALADGEESLPTAVGPGERWRRIDRRWLDRASDLALQLDNHTNNTSLAMAIELTASRQVLLFPGDAQVGSWLSWHDLEWPGEDSTAAVTLPDLLRRTVFYKVGHHGSHNATLRHQGLEKMGADLVAMLPVDEVTARKPKGGNPDGWNIPFPPLLQALMRKTRNRVIRLDTGIAEPSEWTEEWTEFERGVAVDERFIDYTLSAGTGET